MVDDARRGVVDEGEERREEGRVGFAPLVGGREGGGDQLGVIEQAPWRRRELVEVLGLGVQRVVERCRDPVRLTTTRTVTPDT
ncbi:MAG: hypothetical protein ACJ739_09655 [Acidimicrobiales bacterium]